MGKEIQIIIMKSLLNYLRGKKPDKEIPKEKAKPDSAGLERNEGIDVYDVKLKEALFKAARENEILESELEVHMPFVLINLLCRKGFLERSRLEKDVAILGKSETEEGWTRCRIIRRQYYQLTNKGAELANRLDEQPIRIRVYNRASGVIASEPINALPDGITVKGIGFGYTKILPNPELDELLEPSS